MKTLLLALASCFLLVGCGQVKVLHEIKNEYFVAQFTNAACRVKQVEDIVGKDTVAKLKQGHVKFSVNALTPGEERDFCWMESSDHQWVFLIDDHGDEAQLPLAAPK